MARESQDGSKTYLIIESYGTGTINGGKPSSKSENCIINKNYIIVEEKVSLTHIKKILSIAETNDSKIKTGTVITNGEDKYTVIKLGDVDGNGDIDIIDMALIKRHLTGSQKLKNEYLEAAKIKDRENTVDIVDLALIKRHLMGTSLITID